MSRSFLMLFIILSVMAYAFSFLPQYAPWFGFSIAAYSIIANDSIQTLGTFLSSRKHSHWLSLWFFCCSIMLICLTYGWWANQGDMAFGRLQAIPEAKHFSFGYLIAPVILLLLTRCKIPVSTTFLLLSVFSHDVVIQAMLMKTVIGYCVAFASGLIIWLLISCGCRYYTAHFNTYNHRLWVTLQFFSTGWLWSVWIMHDMANTVVYLPRQIDLVTFVLVVSFLALTLALLIYRRGGEIQEIVLDKYNTEDVRAATLIDFIYAAILYYFKTLNHLPMSTTWVFLGLLAGRELAMNLMRVTESAYGRIIVKDLLRASVGLLVSLLIAYFT